MSTSLDRRAYDQRKIWRNKKEADARAARNRAMQQAKDRAARANNVRKLDIFGKDNAAKKAEADLAAFNAGAVAQRADDEPRETQQPKTQGQLAGRVIGAIDNSKLNALLAAKSSAQDLALAAQTAAASCYSLAGQIDGQELRDEISGAAQAAYAAAQQIIVVLENTPVDVVKVFRARKGESQ